MASNSVTALIANMREEEMTGLRGFLGSTGDSPVPPCHWPGVGFHAAFGNIAASG
jgi:hypothetical protein